MTTARRLYCAGFSMIEVLVTLIIILVALLGIAALQAQAHVAELEAQQRAQALIMLSDITDRMNINRSTVSCFAFTTDPAAGTPYLGAVGTTNVNLGSYDCTAGTATYNNLALDALDEIDALLKGASETAVIGGVTENVGGMIGARACISYDAASEIGGIAGTGLYTIVVSWQGMADLVAPAADCANGEYGDEAKRRAVSTQMRVADLL